MHVQVIFCIQHISANAVSMQKSALRLPSCQHSYFFFFPPAIINDSIFSIPLEEGLWSALWSRVMWLSHAGVCFWTRRGCVSLQACLCVCVCVRVSLSSVGKSRDPDLFLILRGENTERTLSNFFLCLFPSHIYAHPCTSILVRTLIDIIMYITQPLTQTPTITTKPLTPILT